MERSVKSKVIIESYSNPANSALGLLQVAYNLLPFISDEYESMNRWNAAENVAREFETNPLEVLVLDTPTAMLPEKRKKLIENPEILFGKRYKFFLRFADKVTKNDGEVLKVNPKVFTPELLAHLGISRNSDSSYRQIIEDAAVTFLRNNLPHFVAEHKSYDPSLPINKHYDAVAKQTKDGILAAFVELVDNNFPDKDEQYKERVALLAGLAAIEVLFVPKKDRRLHPKLIRVVAKGFEPSTSSM